MVSSVAILYGLAFYALRRFKQVGPWIVRDSRQHVGRPMFPAAPIFFQVMTLVAIDPIK